MNAFDLLALVAACAAVLNFLRFRTATFVVAAYQVLTLRSLSSMHEHGRPTAFLYLPPWIFSENNLGIALNIFTIATGVLAVTSLLPTRKPPPVPKPLPPIPRVVLILLGIYFAVLIVSVRTILSVQYASSEQTVFFTPTGGVQAVLSAAVMYELYRRVQAGLLTSTRAIAYFVLLFALTDYLKGLTGMATGFVLAGTVLFATANRRPRLKALATIGAVLLVLTTIGFVIRLARTSFHEGPAAAVTQAVDTLSGEDSNSNQSMEKASSSDQFAVHVLLCVTLYESGRSREWRSLYNPLIYTFQPAFLVHWLNWERPKEAAWELGDHFPHTGGISVYGESYWNGGYFCVFVTLAAILFLSYFIDTGYSFSMGWLLAYANFTPLLLQGMNYGIAYEMRGLINTGLVLALYGAFRAVKKVNALAKRRAQLTDTAPQGST